MSVTNQSEIALDEISALSAIFCERDEFVLLEETDAKGVLFRIQVAVGEFPEEKTLRLHFHLPPDYPSCVPIISVSSEQLSRNQCQDIKRSLLAQASGLISEPMVHQLLLWLQQNFASIVSSEAPLGHPSPTENTELCRERQCWTVLLLIDHMRAKAKYIKIIEKWTSELELTGRLFLGRLILILLQGTRRHIKEYLHLQKTTKVDVDSAGKKCKEKMMSVLCERPLPEELMQIAEFEVREFSSLEELKAEFDSVALSRLYEEFVHTLF